MDVSSKSPNCLDTVQVRFPNQTHTLVVPTDSSTNERTSIDTHTHLRHDRTPAGRPANRAYTHTHWSTHTQIHIHTHTHTRPDAHYLATSILFIRHYHADMHTCTHTDTHSPLSLSLTHTHTHTL